MTVEETTPEVNAEMLNRATFAQKMIAVMNGVQRIPKNGFNKFQGYKFAQEGDILEAIRALFIEHKIICLWACHESRASVIKTKKGEARAVEVLMEGRLIDAETGYAESFAWVGEAIDTSDKAIWQAYTGAVKYWLLKTFMIPTGDEPDSHDSEQYKPSTVAKEPEPEKGPTGAETTMLRDMAKQLAELLIDKGWFEGSYPMEKVMTILQTARLPRVKEVYADLTGNMPDKDKKAVAAKIEEALK